MRTLSASKSTPRTRRWASRTVSAMALALATQAQAQDNQPPADEADAGEAIVVTGSRLVTSGMDSPVPVTAVAAEELNAMDPGALINAVSQLPQFYGNQTPNNSNFFVRGGTGNLNLRGLGPNRTLTLLNGRRVPATSAFGGVDINLFPEAMIRGIETVTGGASAAYGTDAVAGVVNFLIDTDFEGLQFDVQAGITDENDGANYEAKGAWGMALGDRGHLLLSASWAKQEGIHDITSREWYRNYGAINTGTTAAPFWDVFPDVRSIGASFDGIIYAPNTPINGLALNRDGTLAPLNIGSINTGAGTVGNQGRAVGAGNDLNAELFTLYPDTQRYSAFAYGEYDLTDDLMLFGQYMRGWNKQFQYNTPRSSLQGVPTAITIFRDNAFIPQQLRTILDANPTIASFNLRRVGSIEDIGDVWFRDEVTQNVGTAGFEASVLGNWKLNGYYQYGKSKRIWDQYTLRVDRIFAAVDAVKNASGNIVCRVSTVAAGAAAFPGCQPLNLFGRGNASPGAIDYVLGNDPGLAISTPLYFANLGLTGETYDYTSVAPKRNVTTFEQHLAEVSAAGELFDGWAGPISLALGASWRKESIYQVVQDTANLQSNHDGGYRPCPTAAVAATLGLRGLNPPDCNNTVAFQFSKVSNVQGQATVKEAFAETLIPLVNAGSFDATLNLAGRWADYSGSGSIWAYKAGLDVAPSDWLRLRGTYSRDVRAGNLSERFDKTGGTANVTDPRSVATNPTYGGTTYQTTIFSGGNPAIQPEKADTYTAGIVFQPAFLPGFSASADWYKVGIRDAIAQLTVNDVARRCLIDQEPTFCALVTTDPGQNGKIILVGNQFVNINKLRVEGIDAEVGYRTSADIFGGGDESLGFRFLASWLLDRSDVGAPTAAAPNGAVTRFDGLTGIAPDSGTAGIFPKFKANANLTYRNGGFSSFMQARVIGKGKNTYLFGTAPAVEGVNIADNSVPAVTYIDLRLGYEVPVANSTAEFWASITNLFDKAPPVTATYSTFTATSTQYNAALFDVLGRRFTLGIKFKL
ncbi:TonB-dependent receptor domain-containing protein [Tsuneonella sp. HG222]